MAAAFQSNAFQSNAFQTDTTAPPPATMGGGRAFSSWEGKRTKRERLADEQRERERAANKVAFRKTIEDTMRPPVAPEQSEVEVPLPRHVESPDTTAHDRRELEIARLREIAANATVTVAEINARGNLAEIRKKAQQRLADDQLAIMLLLTA